MPKFYLVKFGPHFFADAPNIVLRQKSASVTKFDADLRQLGNGMLQLLDELGYGIGLGAPQVGVLQRVIVLKISSSRSRYTIKPQELEDVSNFQSIRTVLVNPKVIRRSSETELDYEGSLSLPGYKGLVERSISLEIQAQDLDGNLVSFSSEGLIARVIQHEMDYLDGILYTDRMLKGEKLLDIEDK